MKKVMAQMQYLLGIQIKDINNLFAMFALPIALFVYNSLRSGSPFDTLNAFAMIAPVQSMLFSFGSVLIIYKNSGALIKYQLMGFRPIEASLGIMLNALLFQFLGLLSLIIIASLMANAWIPVNVLLSMAWIASVMSLFNFALVLILMMFCKNYQNYSTFASIALYAQIFALAVFKGELPLLWLLISGIIMSLYGLRHFKWHVV